jgi:hypothetical protein
MALIEYIGGGILMLWLMNIFLNFEFDKSRDNSERETTALLIAMVATNGAIGFWGASYDNPHIKALSIPFIFGLYVAVFLSVVLASIWVGGKVAEATVNDKVPGQWIGGLLAVLAGIIGIFLSR